MKRFSQFLFAIFLIFALAGPVPAATFVHFQDFAEALGLGQHNLNADTFKVYLSNVTPSVSADADKTDLAEIATGNGYTGPEDITNAYTETGGTGTMTATDVVITASGGAIAQFRYVVIFNDTHTTDGLMGYYDYGSAVDLADGESITIDFGASLFTIEP